MPVSVPQDKPADDKPAQPKDSAKTEDKNGPQDTEAKKASGVSNAPNVPMDQVVDKL